MMAVRYVHTNIVCRDWEKLVSFYVDVFECTVRLPERHLSGSWLEKGTGVHLVLPGYGPDGPTLEVFQYGESLPLEGVPAANREGFSHIAFQVDDVAAKLDELLSNGGSTLGEVVTADFPSGRLVFTYAADPEGNVIEIQNWRTV